jgi:hypothetical protein
LSQTILVNEYAAILYLKRETDYNRPGKALTGKSEMKPPVR